MANTAKDVLKKASEWVGYTRWGDEKEGTVFGRWYAKKMRNPEYGYNGVPYCAMFVSWVFDQVGAKCAGLPEAYCPSIYAAAKKAGKLVDKRKAKPGDVVLFDWNKDGVADHVGIVRKNNGINLSTVEGNTSRQDQSNGGTVANRVRAWSSVKAIVRPSYRRPETYRTHRTRYLYSKPSTRSKRLVKIPKGSTISYLKEAKGVWRKCSYKGRHGWVASTSDALKVSKWSD